MTASLKLKIDRPIPLAQLAELAATRIAEMLNTRGRKFKVGFHVPPGASFSEAPSMIPDHPRWGLYFYLEGVDESLVDAHLSTLSMESGHEPVVLHLEERRTPASKALAASLAIAAGELLNQNVFDDEHVWTDLDEIRPSDLQRQLSASEPRATIDSALNEFVQRMKRAM